MSIELFPHQKEALANLKNGSVLKGGVGSGKTLTSLAYYVEHESPKDILVVTTARKRDSLDWESEAAYFGIGKKRDATVYGVLTVISYNQLSEYAESKNIFLIVDEQRLVGNGAWVKAFLKLAKTNHWIMLSATPGDNWSDYINLFIANGFYRNRSEFTHRHIVFKPYMNFPAIDKYIDTGHLERLRRQITVEMPFERHTVRHHHNVLCDYDKEKYNRLVKDRWNIFEDRPIKDAAELFLCMRRLVNSDWSRYGELMKLIEKHPKLIVFYRFDYELGMIRTLRDVLNIDVAEWNGHVHQDIPTSDQWIYAVQYAAGNEAWNCIDTDAIAFWSLDYSYKVFEQAQGRIDRLNTPYRDLHYYILRSIAPIDQAIWRALSVKKKFNEKEHYKQFGFDHGNMELAA